MKSAPVEGGGAVLETEGEDVFRNGRLGEARGEECVFGDLCWLGREEYGLAQKLGHCDTVI